MGTQLLARVRSSGSCPPTLIADVRRVEEDGFSEVVSRLLDGADGLTLGRDKNVVDGFEAALKMAEGVESIPGNIDLQSKTRALELRRCILLAVIGATSPSNTALKQILSRGFLVVVKSWLDDILTNLVGGVDLLLHLLTNIALLPVTKEMVTSSKLGKAVAAVEKHKICTGGKNESAIKARISRVKEEWSASVKVNKQNAAPFKRSLDSSSGSSPKKAKTDDQGSKKGSSFSSLLKKVSTPADMTSASKARAGTQASGTGENTLSAAEAARLKAQERDAKLKERLASLEPPPPENGPLSQEETDQNGMLPKKESKHIKWADTDGGTLLVSQEVEIGVDKSLSQENDGNEDRVTGAVSWSDRRKRDRLREKELLLKARKSKIVDKEDSLDTMTMMASAWHKPQPLPPDQENPPFQVVSKEVSVQARRMTSVLPASYLSDEDVPSNPTPLTDIEQALDMTSQSSSVPAAIPFFIPQQEPQTMLPSTTIPIQQQTSVTSSSVPLPGLSPTPQVTSGATLETVQSMGLPLFLVGSNVQALQTLAASPSLLNTFVDANGMYDQTRLMALVHTLTQNLSPAQPQSVGQSNMLQGAPGAIGFQIEGSGAQFGASQTSTYQSPPQSSAYGPASHGGHQLGGAYRGDQNGSDGNLHISGYGPSTTQSDIIALFSPYVQVDEVVMKGTFSFVNTSDPSGAKRAREALNGALLGGTPVRINSAVRRARDPARAESRAVQKSQAIRSEAVPLPRNTTGQIDYEQVRDDRGNPATKNLFVAGYGTGTTEQQLRDIFSQHATVVGVVMKTTFSFVNTSDRVSAVHAREALIGSVVNGGVLRINFAKESGRLGTSFDSTYGPGSHQRYSRHPVF